MTRSLLLVSVTLSFCASARATAYGLAIGNNAPPVGVKSLPTLRYADDDAVRFFQFFARFTDSARLLSVLDAESQRRYPDMGPVARPASLVELNSAIDDLARRIRADVARGDEPSVYIAFSGHGARADDGAAFLAFSDGRLSRQQLYDEVLAKLEPAYVHLFIDACHAEGVVGGRGPEDSAAAMASVDSSEAAIAFEPRLPGGFPRLGALLATTADQQAHEWSRIESGVFTHELLSALSGAADANGDGVIEYSEARAFIASANRDLADPRAVPRVVALPPSLNVHAPLIALRRLRDTGFLTGRFDFGRFFVELESGQRTLDAHLSSDQTFVVAVPAGRVFVVTPEKEAAVMVTAGQVQRVDDLMLVPRSAAARGALSDTLNRELFHSAFGATYYKGYVDSLREASVVFDPPGTLSVADRVEQRRTASSVLLGISGALLVGAVVSSVGVGINQADYERTNLQRPAAEARARVAGFSVAAGIGGGLAAAGALTGWLLWPRQSDLTLSPQVTQAGASLGVSGVW